MTEEEIENYSKLNLKEQLYILYLEIKGELTKKNIKIERAQLEELISTTKTSIIINYIRELIYIY